MPDFNPTSCVAGWRKSSPDLLIPTQTLTKSTGCPPTIGSITPGRALALPPQPCHLKSILRSRLSLPPKLAPALPLRVHSPALQQHHRRLSTSASDEQKIAHTTRSSAASHGTPTTRLSGSCAPHLRAASSVSGPKGERCFYSAAWPAARALAPLVSLHWLEEDA